MKKNGNFKRIKERGSDGEDHLCVLESWWLGEGRRPGRMLEMDTVRGCPCAACFGDTVFSISGRSGMPA